MGVLFSLISAVVYGSGDFCGGLAARRGRPFPVTALASLSGLVIVAAAAWLRGETWPGLQGVIWSLAGGASGMVGIAALYHALATGRAAVVAPTAAVVGAAVALLAGILIDGWPKPLQSVGLLVGLAGILLVSRPEAANHRPETAGDLPAASGNAAFGLAILAGVFFGGFFIFLALVEDGLIFSPLVLAKIAALSLALLVILAQSDRLPAPASNPMALLAGVLDAGGNIFYLLAIQYTRLDLAALLTSMYPASTVLLSALLLHERIGPIHRLGLLLCLAASALIAI